MEIENVCSSAVYGGNYSSSYCILMGSVKKLCTYWSTTALSVANLWN